MTVPMTVERMIARDRAIHAWVATGGDFDRLVALDRAVRRGVRTDWPGRGWGPEPRQAPARSSHNPGPLCE